jgi:RNA polymerase sigma factor (sigma-70 family)
MSNADADALDQADMARLRAGHDAALNDLMARHAGALFGFLSRFTGDEDAANDLAQETFVRVYQNRSAFKSGARFSPWLFTIAGNLARNHLRSRSRRPEVPLDAPGKDNGPGLTDCLAGKEAPPDESFMRDEQHAAVRCAVAELPDDLREAVVLCELDDCSVAEAAGLLSTTVKAVESRLYRARQQLRQRLSRWLASV